MRKNSRSWIRNLTRQTVLRSPATRCANYPRQLHPPFRAVSRRSRIYRRGSSGDEPGFLVGRISKLSFHPRKTMFCEVRREGRRKGAGKGRVTRAYISRFMSLARVERTSFRRFLSRSGNFVLPLAAKKGSRANAVVFSQRHAMFFSNIDVAIPFPPLPSLPTPSSSFSLSFDPLSIFPRPSTTRIRSTVSSPCSTRPTSTTTPAIHPPFSLLLFLFLFPATSAGILVPFPLVVAGLPPLVLLQPRKSKLDAKTRPNVHNARRPTYRVSGTIAGGHRFPPPGRDKCEDGEYRRFVPWLPRRRYMYYTFGRF